MQGKQNSQSAALMTFAADKAAATSPNPRPEKPQ